MNEIIQETGFSVINKDNLYKLSINIDDTIYKLSIIKNNNNLLISTYNNFFYIKKENLKKVLLDIKNKWINLK